MREKEYDIGAAWRKHAFFNQKYYSYRPNDRQEYDKLMNFCPLCGKLDKTISVDDWGFHTACGARKSAEPANQVRALRYTWDQWSYTMTEEERNEVRYFVNTLHEISATLYRGRCQILRGENGAQCPKCGKYTGEGLERWQQPSSILTFLVPSLAKNFKCRNCGYRW